MYYHSLFFLLSIGMTLLASCSGGLSLRVDGDESSEAGEATNLPAGASASLVSAARSGDVAAVVGRLLSADAAPNELEDGRTALMEAAYHDQAAVVLELLKHEAIDPNKQEQGVGGNRTALMTAAAFNSLEVVKVLVSCERVDVNFKADTGVTALMWAAANSSDKAQAIIEALLERPDIDLKTVDNKGRTAYTIARANKANRNILEKLYFEGCAPIEEAVEVHQEKQPIEKAVEVHQGEQPTGESFRQEGNLNLYKHEHEGDINITDLKINNTIHRKGNAPLPNQTGNINFSKSKTKGTITISGSTLTNTINYGDSPDTQSKTNE